MDSSCENDFDDDERQREWEDLDVTKDELDAITNCLKEPEFRKLLQNYADDINNPENRKRYKDEFRQLEKQRGYDVTFIDPEPGYVLKTSLNGRTKCFINVSKSDILNKPSSKPVVNNDGTHGLNWSIPYSLTHPRDDLDKSNVKCRVFDVVFHPDAIYIASKNSRFKSLLNDTAMDAVEKNFKVKLDRNNIKFPKIQYKGAVTFPAVIRKPCEKPKPNEQLDMEPEIYQKIMADYDEHIKKQSKSMNRESKPKRPPPPTKCLKSQPIEKTNNDSDYTRPKYIIKQQSNVEIHEFTNDRDSKMLSAIPKKLIVEINVPLLRTARDAVLDVQEKNLFLKSETPAKYMLELPLPYQVDPDNGTAKFDSKSRKLIVTLPVTRQLSTNVEAKEDSGVDSDHGSPVPYNDENNANQSLSNSLISPVNDNEQFNDNNDNSEEPSRNIEDYEIPEEFINPNIKYSLPPFTCNVFENNLAVIIHAKNVDNESIMHKVLKENSGFHIVLTTVGAGFFPVYYSLCLKISENAILPESITIETWDNNVVVSLQIANGENLSKYYAGLDDNFMEEKYFSLGTTIQNKLQALTEETQPENEKNIEVIRKDKEVIVNVRSQNAVSDDDEDEREFDLSGSNKQKKFVKSRSISESSGDELPTQSKSSYKGILKNKNSHFSRSVSESSMDDNTAPSSSYDNKSDGSNCSFKGILKSKPINYGRSMSETSFSDKTAQIMSSLPNDFKNSDSESCSSLKKTVSFSDCVSRNLYRVNSSILGQRKKNQRKLKNKKRAHERKMSESENSETDDHKFKYDSKNTSLESSEIKPILRHSKNTANDQSQSSDSNNKSEMCHEKENKSEDKEPIESENTNNGFEFKSDLLFELDM